MFKFLRKVRFKMMGKSRAGRYLLYAIGEIILVVIGILIALQINKLNSDSQDREKEKNIKIQLHDEFSQNLKQLNFVVEGNNRILLGLNWAIDNFPNYRNIDIDTTAYYFSLMGATFTFNPLQSTVRSLTNTSSFDLIQDDDLRRKLIQWQDSYEDYIEEENQAQDSFLHTFIPFFEENSNLEWISPYDKIKDPYYEALETRRFYNLLLNRRVVLKFIVDDNPKLIGIRNNIKSIIELTEK